MSIPSKCVGVLIGKSGENLKNILQETGCIVHLAIKDTPDTENRNVFIKGSTNQYLKARKLIEELVIKQASLSQDFSDVIKAATSPFYGNFKVASVPAVHLGAILGKQKSTAIRLCNTYKVKIFISTLDEEEVTRELRIYGQEENCEDCREEINKIVNYLERKTNKKGPRQGINDSMFKKDNGNKKFDHFHVTNYFSKKSFISEDILKDFFPSKYEELKKKI